MRELAIVAFGACAACSLLVDTGDLDEPASGASDAGPDVPPIVPADATVAPGKDGDVSSDTGTSDGDAASGPGFCASHPGALFCDDFDQPDRTDLRTEAWAPTLNNYPIATPFTGQFYSSPRSARILFDWKTPGVASRSGTSRVVGVPANVPSVTVSLRVRPELSVRSDTQWFAASYRSCLVVASFIDAQMNWQEQVEAIGTFSIPFEKWTLVSVTIKIRSNGCDVAMKIGEDTSAIVLPTRSVDITPTAELPTGAIMDVGYVGRDYVGAFSFDDVLVSAD